MHYFYGYANRSTTTSGCRVEYGSAKIVEYTAGHSGCLRIFFLHMQFCDYNAWFWVEYAQFWKFDTRKRFDSIVQVIKGAVYFRSLNSQDISDE